MALGFGFKNQIQIKLSQKGLEDLKSAIYMPAPLPFGGAERRFAYLFFYMKKMNYDTYLVTNYDAYQKLKELIPELAEYESSICAPEINFSKPVRRLLKKIKVAQVIFFIKTIIFLWEKKATHIHFPVNPSGYALIMSIIAPLSGMTISCSVVNSLKKAKSDLSSTQYLAWKYVFNRCSWIDFLSPSIEKNMRTIFNPSQTLLKNSSVSPCSFSYAADMNFSKEISSYEKKIDVLFLSRFIDGKGVDLLLEAIKVLESKQLSYSFLIAGSGPLEDKIREITTDLAHVKCNISYVSDPMGALKASKIALSIQQYENYPSQTLLEAASCNTTVIATDVGDTRMICNEQNSYLIKYSAPALAFAIDYLIKNENLREELSQKFRQDVIHNHSVKKFTEYFILHITAVTNE